jgi:hypothetical protein
LELELVTKPLSICRGQRVNVSDLYHRLLSADWIPLGEGRNGPTLPISVAWPTSLISSLKAYFVIWGQVIGRRQTRHAIVSGMEVILRPKRRCANFAFSLCVFEDLPRDGRNGRMSTRCTAFQASTDVDTQWNSTYRIIDEDGLAAKEQITKFLYFQMEFPPFTRED